MDAFILPALGVTILGFVIYIWVAWLRDPEGRALRISEDDEQDDSRPGFE